MDRSIVALATGVVAGAVLHSLFAYYTAQHSASILSVRISEEDKTDEDRLRVAISILSNAQKQKLALSPLPPSPPYTTQTNSTGWIRCKTAMEAVAADYARWRKKRDHKNVLISAFNQEDPCGWKLKVDQLIASHTSRVFPDLATRLQFDDRLVLLLLEAPSCGTTEALCLAMPSLKGLGHKICIPQADPQHYACMVGELSTRYLVEGRKPTEGGGKRASKSNKTNANVINGNGVSAAAGTKAGTRVESAGSPIDSPSKLLSAPSSSVVHTAMLLNIRQQRLHQWLSSNVHLGLKVAVFFLLTMKPAGQADRRYNSRHCKMCRGS